MSDSSASLPIFGYTNEGAQLEELKDFFVKCGAKGLDGVTKGDVPSAVLAIAKEVGVLGKSLEDPSQIGHTLNSLASLVLTLPSKSAEVTEALCKELTNQEVYGGTGVKSKAYAAFCVLSNLFYGFAGLQSQLQFQLYCAMLEVAGRSELMDDLPTELSRVKEWMKGWNLQVGDQRRCLRLIHQGLVARDSADSAAVMVELLSTYTDKDAKEASPDAYNCVLSAVRNPKTFLYDHLLHLNPVKALQSSHPQLFQLLNILVSGSLKDYQAFQAKEKNYLTSLGLDESAMVHKMRILTLMSLAETRTEVPLNELAATLSMSADEELEDFVIQASLSQAIRARMDQVGGRLLILGADSRVFGRKEWELLRSRLQQWSANLANVNETIAHAVSA